MDSQTCRGVNGSWYVYTYMVNELHLKEGNGNKA